MVQVRLTVSGVVLAVLFSILLAFVLPADPFRSQAWHKGYNLYSAALPLGSSAFLYLISCTGPWGTSARLLRRTTSFTLTGLTGALPPFFSWRHFPFCTIAGYILYGRSFKGFRHLVTEGYSSNFAEKCTAPLSHQHRLLWLLFLFFALPHHPTLPRGRLHLPRTIGVIVAALYPSAMGQYPREMSGPFWRNIRSCIWSTPALSAHGRPGDRLHYCPGLHKRRGLCHWPLPHRELPHPCWTAAGFTRLHARHQCSPRRSGAL